MSYNGSGVYTLPGAQLVNGEIVSATENNTSRNDFAAAFNVAWTRDGQSTATGNIPMGTHKFTGLAAGSAATDSVNLGQTQSSASQLIGSISGADTITGVLTPALSAYAAGQSFRFVSAGANTGAVTLNLNSLGAKSVTKLGTTALVANDIPSGAVVEVVYDGTQFQIVNLVASTVSTATTATNIAGGVAGQVPVQSAAGTTTFMDSSFGFKNRIINGAMKIDQRNAGASVTPTTVGAYTYSCVDRWAYLIGAASKFSMQQNAGSVTPPVGFSNYLGVTSLSSYSVGASDYFMIDQPIEGFNTSDLVWGTANAATVTLSFWVRSSLTGTFGGVINNSASNYTYPFSYTISSANTWEQKSVTISGPTSGTWIGATNGIGMRVVFSLGMGSNYSATAGSWTAAEKYSATGATSVVGTSGATFYITGVQLEKGSTATSFDYRPYGTELALCQRYYMKTYAQGIVPGAVGSYGLQFEGAVFTGNHVIPYPFPVEMRATPSLTGYADDGTSGQFSTQAGNTTANFYGAKTTGVSPYASFNGGWLRLNFIASAEL